MKITDSLIRKSCSSTIYRRGMEYFKEGRVRLKKRTDNLITAVVDGESLYNVMVSFDEEHIKDKFCTCPYFETMGSTCKHIVAAMKQRQTELEEGENFKDENDRLAGRLCTEFAGREEERRVLYAGFTLYVTPTRALCPIFAMSVDITDMQGAHYDTRSVLDKYSQSLGTKAKLNPRLTEFPYPQSEIMDILTETYENRSADSLFHVNEAHQLQFGPSTAKRILGLLKNTGFSLVFDGINMSDVRILEEDPDVIVDVDAYDGEICLSVSERGNLITPDGAYFLYDGIIYHTSQEWREYFVPIYNALLSDGRTQISFKGENKTLFAAHVLPALKGRHGVVTRGIDELIINEKPLFEVYFDSVGNGIKAVVVARYGSVSCRLPHPDMNNEKIILHDREAEENILSFFADFEERNGEFRLFDEEKLYNFLRVMLPRLSRGARVLTTDTFDRFRQSAQVSVSAAVRYNTETDLLETNFTTELPLEEMQGILNAIRLKKTFYRMKDGSFFDLDDSKPRYMLDLIDRLEFSDSELSVRRKFLPKYHALYLNALDDVGKDQSFVDYIEKIRAIEPKIPENLEGVLRFYQRDGVKWLKQLSDLGFGGILADDMGLGKTLQVIAFVHGEKPKKPALIVVPSALTYNWYNEIMRFAPDASALIIDGVRDERARLIETVSDYEFVITSYPILRRDIERYKKLDFSYCFIDEAQYIKNPKTMNARCVKRINAEHKFALTGTPIENSLTELWSIFDFIMSGYLYGLAKFREEYEIPIVKEGSESALLSLRARIKPFILRRMKKDVLEELPEKLEYTMYAELVPQQRKMYQTYLAIARSKTMSLLGEGGKGKMQILTLLMRLRQICCHPALFDENYNGESGKLKLLCELVTSAMDSGHRILIFSQYTSMLEIIRSVLNEKGIKSFYLDGKTPSYERLEMSDRFNSGERSVFLISLRAGGTGLNLIGADTVIHYDPWWNPAAMDQASDRAYRIGQTRDVQVIRLVSKDSIEEKITRLQDAKRSLADDIIKVSPDAFASLTNEEIISLFE
ncbi:MAG: DEAD/DEAH box helicase [Clostridiales bacterium]|nr:DEAD/DEAH box helicase [Clostridiales bacterium]